MKKMFKVCFKGKNKVYNQEEKVLDYISFDV